MTQFLERNWKTKWLYYFDCPPHNINQSKLSCLICIGYITIDIIGASIHSTLPHDTSELFVKKIKKNKYWCTLYTRERDAFRVAFDFVYSATRHKHNHISRRMVDVEEFKVIASIRLAHKRACIYWHIWKKMHVINYVLNKLQWRLSQTCTLTCNDRHNITSNRYSHLTNHAARARYVRMKVSRAWAQNRNNLHNPIRKIFTMTFSNCITRIVYT